MMFLDSFGALDIVVPFGKSDIHPLLKIEGANLCLYPASCKCNLAISMCKYAMDFQVCYPLC